MVTIESSAMSQKCFHDCLTNIQMKSGEVSGSCLGHKENSAIKDRELLLEENMNILKNIKIKSIERTLLPLIHQVKKKLVCSFGQFNMCELY